MKIGILGAMSEEICSIKQLILQPNEVTIANRTFTEGFIGDTEVVVAFSRWGKVAAASTTTTLINRFNVDLILFTGVAGAVHDKLNIGDIVIGNGLYQHDMDARPLYDQFQIPLTHTTIFKPNPFNTKKAFLASEKFLVNIAENIEEKNLRKHSIFKLSVHYGLIASGDKFITEIASCKELNYSHGDSQTLAVEMEGAAVAQVCEDYEKPYVIIRTISDKANHNAPVDFQSFIVDIASKYSVGIINNYIMG